MNFIALETEKKLRGGFYTEPSIAAFLVKWVGAIKPSSILEPSCGDGVFLSEIEKQNITSLEQVTACEIDEEEAEKASRRTKLPVRILKTDFLRWYLYKGQYEGGFDSVIGNPPFIRYQYLPDEQQQLAEKIFEQLKLPFTNHTNAWVPFVLASVNILKPGGRLAMVIPSELFHIPHAKSLRKYLAEQCARILILDPTEIWFSDTLQGTVLLLAEKKSVITEHGQGVGIIPIKNRQMLSCDPEFYFQSASYTNGITLEGKWMHLFLSPTERGLLSKIKSQNNVKQFSEVASVDVGIVTGANKFFLVPDSVVEEYSLQKWAYPMFGRSAHARGLIYSLKDHQDNKDLSLPANFLWFKEDNIEELPLNVRKYLETGLAQNLQSRFKCRTRKTWYKVPSVYATPIGMLKRANHFPRLILNNANAYTTDTAYRIKPIGIDPELLVLAFANSLTCLTAEIEGRHYGGGVLELVPTEIEKLLVPVIKASNEDFVQADLNFRNSVNYPEFLHMQDAIVLGNIGINKSDQELIHIAWLRLHDRRHRIADVEDIKVDNI